MKKVVFLTYHLGFGGAENVLCNIVNMINSHFNVEIISIYKLAEKPAFDLPDNVKIKYLLGDLKENRQEFMSALKKGNPFKIISQGLKSIKILYYRYHKTKQYIKQSDAEIIFSNRILTNNLVSKYAKNNIIKIAMEHNHHDKNTKYIRKLIKSWQGIDYVIPPSKELTMFYQERLNEIKSKTKLFYIRHAIDYFPNKIDYKPSKKLISIGRLSSEKGMLDLIDIFKIINNIDKEFTLDIFGDGSEKEKIEAKIKENNLIDYISIHGFQTKDVINKYLNNSALFVMTSYKESFGLVLLEAMSFGVPCIAFSSAKGALEILGENNGILILKRDKSVMARKIVELCQEPTNLKKYSQKSRIASTIYCKENVQREWLSFLKRL